jgi:hypothetical protein
LYYKAADGSVPALEFLDACPGKIDAEFTAVLDAVAAAPPPQFSGGGKWEAMHARVDHPSGPDLRSAAYERRRSLSGQPADKITAKRAVLIVQLRVAERVGDCRDRASNGTHRGWDSASVLC